MYLKDIEELKVIADSIPNTRMMGYFKVSADYPQYALGAYHAQQKS